MIRFYSIVVTALVALSCSSSGENTHQDTGSVKASIVAPSVVTDTVPFDSDDPAIWINRHDPAQSLIIGTDKGGDGEIGGIYVFDLHGKILQDKVIRNIKRPNNIDVAYDFQVGGKKVDVIVFTERNTNSLRVYTVPGMQELDNGGIPVFENDTARSPMGVSLYSHNNNLYAFVSRKSGPSTGYLGQYLLEDSGAGIVKGRWVRNLGNYSGKNEIESIAVDNELGYVYYSDEGKGVRKYYAHPDSSQRELAIFGETGFKEDHEGISIYKDTDSTGFILVSDQQANAFHIFTREGSATSPHDHRLVKIINTKTTESDGSDVTSSPLPGFPKGIFVAMSDDKTFQIYDWRIIMPDSTGTGL